MCGFPEYAMEKKLKFKVLSSKIHTNGVINLETRHEFKNV